MVREALECPDVLFLCLWPQPCSRLLDKALNDSGYDHEAVSLMVISASVVLACPELGFTLRITMLVFSTRSRRVVPILGASRCMDDRGIEIDRMRSPFLVGRGLLSWLYYQMRPRFRAPLICCFTAPIVVPSLSAICLRLNP